MMAAAIWQLNTVEVEAGLPCPLLALSLLHTLVRWGHLRQSRDIRYQMPGRWAMVSLSRGQVYLARLLSTTPRTIQSIKPHASQRRPSLDSLRISVQHESRRLQIIYTIRKPLWLLWLCPKACAWTETLRTGRDYGCHRSRRRKRRRMVIVYRRRRAGNGQGQFDSIAQCIQAVNCIIWHK